MFNEKEYIIDLSLNNKENIKFYKDENKIFMKKDLIVGSNVKGIKINDDKIETQIIHNNKYIYLPDIEYTNEKDLLTAIINRDQYIEYLAENCENEDEINDILHKKNLPCCSSNILENF